MPVRIRLRASTCARLALLALLTTLTTTLLCILHCHSVAQPTGANAPPVVVYAGQRLFICHSIGDALPGPVSPISPGMLRGLYELAPSLGSMLLLPLLLLALLSGEPEHRVSLPGNPPEPPPPRDLLRLN